MAWFAYVFPCTWEDHCKIGFSRDPLARIGQLHRRWFEFFDLERGLLVETECEREARDIELALRGPLRAHRAPQPLTVRDAAGGRTEWVRGADAALREAVLALERDGYPVHAPLSAWLRAALHANRAVLYEWTQAQLQEPELAPGAVETARHGIVRDALDAHAALDVDIAGVLPPPVLRWYRRGTGMGD